MSKCCFCPELARVSTSSVCLIGLATLSSLLLAGCTPSTGPSIRLVTWNVRATQAGAEVIAGELQRLAPDIICLQEVESGMLESPGPNQAEAIAHCLGMKFAATPPPRPNTPDEQIAIFAHEPLSDPQTLDAGTGSPYGITVEYQAAGGRCVRIVAVHLTSTDWSNLGRQIATSHKRFREANDLKSRMTGWTGDIILAGDLNAGPGMIEHALLANQANWVFSLAPTFPNQGAILQLDHVFLKGSLRAMRIFTERTTASDHCRLVADIRLLSRPAASQDREDLAGEQQ